MNKELRSHHRENRNLYAALFCAIIPALFLALLCPAVSFAAATLSVSAAHPILPVTQGVLQKIEIGLSPDGLIADREYKIQISSESGMGMMQLPGGFATRGEVLCKAGGRVSVIYRWAGALPTEKANEETVTVSIPEIGVTETAEFSIGVDLRVTGIRLPEGTGNSRWREIGLTVEDTLHPNADLAAMLENLNIAPEVTVALFRESSAVPLTPAEDAFAAKFLGRSGAPQETITFPSAYRHGHLRKTPDGETYEWIAADGQAPGFAPPSGGRYQLKVSLRPGTGGVAVRDTLSSAFEVTGAEAIDLPGFMGSTAAIIAAYSPDTVPELTSEVRAALQQGENAQAASLLGAGIRKTRASSPSHILGKYLEILLASQGNVEELVPYIQSFLQGYGEYGVLILSRSGVASWKAILPDKAELTQAPTAIAETPSALARLYAGERHVVIPFELGRNFTLNITGSNKGGTSLWKIIPEGVNRKAYPQGDWEKEIAVHTETVLPAAN